MDRALVSVTLTSLGGEPLGTISVEPTAYGRDLVRRAKAFANHGVVKLINGTNQVDEHLIVSEQCLEGADLKVVVMQFDRAATRRVAQQVLGGAVFAQESEEWQMWNSI